ncbi:MAG TPA: 50S ribosomal protein L18 [Dictyobacter sp.]|jgi:ribosomal protein L18|nr:50S ribosomal protein L18 [Dictyobacter sp.]
MLKRFEANKARLRRHQRIRRHLTGTSVRPRLNVFRSGHHIYAQIIDDSNGRTLVAASTLDESLRNFTPEEKNLSTATEQSEEAPKSAKKSQVEQLAGIVNNRKVALAFAVGKLVAQRAKEHGVTQVVFDRGGYAYHGRVAALAEGAREEGLSF